MPAGNITADGTLFEFDTLWDGYSWHAMLHLSGNFGGGTVQIYQKADGGPTLGPGSDGWLALKGGAYTEANDDIINCAKRCSLKAVLTGATGPNIDWNII